MLVVTLHGLIISLFLLWGMLCPRQPVSMRDTLVNLTTGLLLAGGRALLGGALLSLGLAPAPAHAHSGLLWLLRDLALAFVVADCARYWLHRLHHTVPALWRFHRVHHSSTFLDGSSGLRMHVVDFAQLTLLPVLLFRFVVDGSAFHPWTWPLLVLVTDLFDAWQHANLGPAAIPPQLLRWSHLINNPVAHSWHHSTDPRAYNRNYGQALMVWDRCFGTWLATPEPAPEFGLPADDAIETTVHGLQLLQPATPHTP